MDRKIFTEAKHQLKAMESADRVQRRSDFRLCDWENPEDVAELFRTQRAEARRKLLDQLVPDHVCPDCERVRIHDRSWIVNNSRSACTCRSCFARRKGYVMVDARDTRIVNGVVSRFEYSGKAITELRKKMGCSAKEFAKLAGWSRSYQQMIEADKYVTLDKDTIDTILEVFRDHGVITGDTI